MCESMSPFKQTAVNCKIKLSNWLTGRYETLSRSLSLSLNQEPTQNQLRTASLAKPKPTANAWRILGESERERVRKRERERLPHLLRDEHCSKWQWAHVSRKSVPQTPHTHALALSHSLYPSLSVCQPQSITSKRILIFIKIIKTCAKTVSKNVVRYLYTL